MNIFKKFQKKLDKSSRILIEALFGTLKCPRAVYNILRVTKKRFRPSDGVRYQ